VALAASLLLGGSVAASVGDPAGAQANPFQRGPAPTTTSVQGDGPFAIAQATVARQSTFGGGTIYYPTDTSQGTFAGIALSPGFTESQSYMAPLARRLATHGFVVLNIDVLNTLTDQPNARADQLQAAVRWLTSTASPVRARVDANRLGVGGHSMGGGGAIEAASEMPSLKASIGFEPWNGIGSWPGVRVPTMIQGAQNDNIAPVAQHSEPFYASMTNAPEKAYAEFTGASHFFSGQAGPATTRLSVSWYKRFLDNDTRYDQFLCPGPRSPEVVEYRNTCPLTTPGGGGGTTTTTRPGGTTTTTRPTTTTTAPPPACQWGEWWCWLGWG
jgi:dienelactone hydrolase